MLQPLQIEELIQDIPLEDTVESKFLLTSLRSSEIAQVLEGSRPTTRRVIWQLLEEEDRNQVLQHLGDEVRAEFLDARDTAQLVAAADDMDTDDFADILQQLPTTISEQVLASLDASDRARVEAVLSFPEDSAGGLMDTDSITVRPRHTLELVLRYLRLRKELPSGTDALIVVNSEDQYLGMLPLTKVLTSDPSVTAREIMNSDAPAMRVDQPDKEIARAFSERDLISAAVVDDDGRLLGRITIDDVVDVIIEDAEEAVLGPAGLDVDEDTLPQCAERFVVERYGWV